MAEIQVQVVWVQLYIGKDKSGDVFEVPSGKSIDAFKKAVHQEAGNLLGHCRPFQLDVYNAGIKCPSEDEAPLSPWEGVPKDITGPRPLRVVAPQKKQGKNFMALSFLPDSTCSMHTLRTSQ
jgi:hypothetical protein